MLQTVLLIRSIYQGMLNSFIHHTVIRKLQKIHQINILGGPEQLDTILGGLYLQFNNLSFSLAKLDKIIWVTGFSMAHQIFV